MKEQSHDIYLDFPEPQQSALLALRGIILAFDENISETVKYGMPCFLYKKNILCYCWADKKTGEPYILMAEGNYLEHPLLEKGDRARMKMLRIHPEADIPVKTVREVLSRAIDLYRKGWIKLK